MSEDLIQAPAETDLVQAQQKPGEPQCDHLRAARDIAHGNTMCWSDPLREPNGHTEQCNEIADDISVALAEAAAEEARQCAKIASEEGSDVTGRNPRSIVSDIVNAIRARGDVKC